LSVWGSSTLFIGENSILSGKRKKVRSLFGVRELAPVFGSGTICGQQSGGKPPHSKADNGKEKMALALWPGMALACSRFL
jgi:hypothetical protein